MRDLVEAPQRNIQNENVKRKFKLIETGKMDITFFALVLILLTIGLVMLFSASYAFAYQRFGNSYHFITRQLGFAVFGVAAMYFFSRIDYHIYRKFAWILYVVSVGLLVVALIIPPMMDGFHRWIYINVGGTSINFQPSEIAKFAVIVLFAHLISKNYTQMKTFKFGILVFSVLLLTVVSLVIVAPHFSAAVIIFVMGFAMMIIGGIRLKFVGIGLGAGAAGIAAVTITGLVDVASTRFRYWRDPWADPQGFGYQIIQSLLAIGSGGFLGAGLGRSRQKYLWVPEPHNDFIFSIVAEELGFIGALIIVLLFACLVWRGFAIAMRAPDKFGSLLCVGLVFQVGLQAVLNMLVVTNTIPNTGISLPFFSYGGTALLMLMAQMGVVLSISRSCRMAKNA